MHHNIKAKLFITILASSSIILLTGCHTVQGTVHGAGEDLESVSNTMTPPHHYYHKHRHHVKKTTTTTTTTTTAPKTSLNNSSDQGSNQTTTQQTSPRNTNE